MADKTMPPSDPNESSEGNPQMVTDLAPEMPQGSPAEGSVMISVPESAFKTMHQMIVQIAQGFDQLAQGVYQQATGQTQGQPTAPEGEKINENCSLYNFNWYSDWSTLQRITKAYANR